MLSSLKKGKFVDYLTKGIPIVISNEDVPVFYEKLEAFINSCDNEFESVYIKQTGEVIISDQYVDYLIVSYEDSRIVFRTTPHTKSPTLLLDEDTQRKMGEAFLGVVLFVESLSPSEDSETIPEIYHDRWKIQ